MYAQTLQPESSLNSHKRTISDLIMAMMGVDRLAYIRPTSTEEFTVYAADGTALACFESHDEALSTIRQFNLVPVSVH